MKLGNKTVRSVARMAALPAIVLGMGFLVCGTPANAQLDPSWDPGPQASSRDKVVIRPLRTD
jgi:hypothetical protein